MQIWKTNRKWRIKQVPVCLANISPTKAWIFMKFYMVVNYYLVSYNFKFHEDLCINARAWIVNTRGHVLSYINSRFDIKHNRNRCQVHSNIRFSRSNIKESNIHGCRFISSCLIVSYTSGWTEACGCFDKGQLFYFNLESTIKEISG